jgi:5-methylthioadenosine/S-adenosylhomocysteine deaminase
MWSVADQLAQGVTTIGHTGPGRLAFDALRTVGARGVAYAETFGPDPAQCETSLADLRARVDDMRRDESPVVRVGVSPHAPYSVSDALFAAVAAYARAEHLPMAVHIAESPDESDLVAHGTGAFAEFLRGRGIDVAPRASSPVALLERTGVLAAQPLCIHAVRVDANDIDRLAGAGATVAHCPLANAWFASPPAPLAAMRARGIHVGIGTDSLASNDGVSVLAEASAAADETLTPAQRVMLATRGGAHALGLMDTGCLAVGMQADLAAFGVTDVGVCDADPERFVISHIATAPSALATRTVVAGVERARDGRALGQADGLQARMTAHRARVDAWARAQPWAGERRAHDSRFKG